MDRMIYVAMTGAKHTLGQHATVAHNLANAATAGFRAEGVAFRAVPLLGPGAPTRAFVVDSTPGADFTPGAIQRTGRELDVALDGRGWLAVQLADGGEAYTRHGSLQIGPNGVLNTRSGHAVLGDGGTLSIPDNAAVTIARDGTVGVASGGRAAATAVGRLKLVDPPEAALVRGADGLFRLRDGGTAAADPRVKVTGGALEGSNVNVVDAMISMVALARQFEMQMKLLQNAENNSRQAGELLAVNR
jgi:flagellar basal-body rod protein FlgF